jgi:pyruvate kinase
MDLAGPKIRTRLLNKGKDRRKVKVKEGEILWLADGIKGFKADEIVISPNESGIIQMLKKGERIYIDDGMIKGFIETTKKNKVP